MGPQQVADQPNKRRFPARAVTVNARMMDSGWNPTIAIQSSAFCMTLYRKRLIRGKTRARSHCRFVLLLIQFIPASLRAYSVPLLLKRQCDRTLGKTHAFWYTACLLLSIYHIVQICEDGSYLFLLKVFEPSRGVQAGLTCSI
jgi:hypothetical protein